MAQRKRKLKKRKKSSTHRYHELQSDDEEFEVAAGIKDDQHTVSQQTLNMFALYYQFTFLQSETVSEDFLDSRPRPECVSVMELDTRELIRAQNKKKKKSEAFQSMGETLYVKHCHQSTIPVILDGKDVVAMARTGSGKTAALLIPMFEKLKAPQAQTGARALVLTPTRELALQTMKFTKELLMVEGVECAYIYSALDQTASKINIGRFVQRKAMVLLVTDVVARGIDIPLLDNVNQLQLPIEGQTLPAQSRCDGAD
ncbi:hypothetical protein cypCar_00033337 [Cyprinus carpio]|nr:hypothetical protein cypCar_00033337 [Cyprinus carpio]